MLNEKQFRKLESIKEEKPYYYHAFTTVNDSMKFSVFLHLQCIEQYTCTPVKAKDIDHNNDTTPSLCIVYKNNEISTCLASPNFMELAEKIKNKKNDECTYKFYYIDLYSKSTDVEYYLKKFKHIKQMIKRYIIVRNELQC